ncbi:MAG: hypothetical protein ACI8UO_003748 [Verrucomicrobiales bacterium]
MTFRFIRRIGDATSAEAGEKEDFIHFGALLVDGVGSPTGIP